MRPAPRGRRNAARNGHDARVGAVALREPPGPRHRHEAALHPIVAQYRRLDPRARDAPAASDAQREEDDPAEVGRLLRLDRVARADRADVLPHDLADGLSVEAMRPLLGSDEDEVVGRPHASLGACRRVGGRSLLAGRRGATRTTENEERPADHGERGPHRHFAQHEPRSESDDGDMPRRSRTLAPSRIS
jgi:hypothetical protein